ncbi:MAG: ABC transporter substrate-binding protein [Nitrososphaerales archaeon]
MTRCNRQSALTKIQSLLIVGIIVAVAAIGSFAYVQQSKATTTTSSLNALVQQAEQEGSVTIYTVITSTAIQAVITAFNKQYPSIKVNYYSGSSNDVLTKVQSEAQGGINAVDVIENNYLEQIPLQNSSLITSYVPPEAANISAADTIPNYCYGALNYAVALLYNTNQVKANDLPSTWWQLVQNTSWTGHIGMGDPTIHFTTTQWLLALQPIYGNNWTSFLQDLSALKPSFYHSMTPDAGAVATGSIELGIGLASDGATLSGQGAPIAVKFLQPTLKFDAYVCLATKAPHPAAAKLLMNFMLSQVGQQAEANVGDQMVRTDVSSPFATQMASIHPIVFGQQSIANVTTAQQTTMKQIFG